MDCIINIIGAGNLGKTLGYLLLKQQGLRIGGVCNRSQTSTLDAIRFMGGGNDYARIVELPEADITFITVPDDLIAEVCETLSKSPFLKKGSIVLHCSGALTSDTLIFVKNKGCYTASVHPMTSFAKPEFSIEQYAGTWCAIEGSEEAKPILNAFFKAIGSNTYDIGKNSKPLYHAAGVMASNYLLTLFKQALLCMKAAGVEQETALPAIMHIMRETLANLEKSQSPEHSLTGPLRRGDIHTIKKHMDAFSCEEQKNIYAALGKATLSLTDHEPGKKEALKAIFNAG